MSTLKNGSAQCILLGRNGQFSMVSESHQPTAGNAGIWDPDVDKCTSFSHIKLVIYLQKQVVYYYGSTISNKNKARFLTLPMNKSQPKHLPKGCEVSVKASHKSNESAGLE